MEHNENMEYPFGFGFALMSNPRAMERFFSMSEEEQKEWMKQIYEIESHEEICKALAELAHTRAKPSGRGRKKSGVQKTQKP